MPRFNFFAMDSEFRLGHLVSAHTPTLQQMYEWVTVVYPSTSQDLSLTVRGTGSPLTESDLNERNCDIHINFTEEQLGRPCGGVIPMASAVPTPMGRPAASPATSAAAFPSSSPSLKRKALGSEEDRDDFQGLLKTLCLTRDQACIVTGCPYPAELQCSHVLPPRIAREWVSCWYSSIPLSSVRVTVGAVEHFPLRNVREGAGRRSRSSSGPLNFLLEPLCDPPRNWPGGTHCRL
ncbi:hypothetical protein BDZ88DRAFT_265812 [Geranomyces variabilis]|nr:hypothetical protein BDZ88DRAFT_265812 [Geranomyces variabilis]